METGVISKKKISSNVFFSFASQVITLIIPLITSPYIARVLREEGNGQYSYASSIIMYFILFANLGCDIYGQRQIAKHQGDKDKQNIIFWELFFLKFICTIISFLVLVLIFRFDGFGQKYSNLVMILSIQVIAVPFDIQFMFKGNENFKAIAIRTLTLKILGLVCVFLFVKNQNHVWVYCLCISVSTLFSNLVMWISSGKMIRFISIKNLSIKRHLKPVMLIFLPTLAFTVYSVFDRTMIGILSENADYENGCYEQAYKLNNIIMLFVTVMSPVFLSRNTDDYSRLGIEKLQSNIYFTSKFVWLISLPLFVGTLVTAKNISSWFLGYGYDSVPLILVIMGTRYITAGFGDILGNQFFLVLNKEKYNMIAVLTATIANIIMNLFFIRLWGAVGAALSTAISELIVTAIFLFIAIKGRYIRPLMLIKGTWKYFVSSILMLMVIYPLNRLLSYNILSFLLIVFVGATVYCLSLILLRDNLVKILITILKDKTKIKNKSSI